MQNVLSCVEKINENVDGCNACYLKDRKTGPFHGLINQASTNLVVTDYPPESMGKAEDYLQTRQYFDLIQYFGADWLTRSVFPYSHTFAVKCPHSAFAKSRASPLTRCKMHTTDYIIGVGFKGVIAVGPESCLQLKFPINGIKKTKGGRLGLGLTEPSKSQLLVVESNTKLVSEFIQTLQSQ